MKRRILFVDDEPSMLGLYRLVFEPDAHEFDTFSATSGPEALTLMEQQPFDLVLSDLRMPGMTGVELFQEVIRRFPQASRIVTSGCSDLETVVKCLGATHQFIPKPCDLKVLKSTIRRVCELDRLLLDRNLKEFVGTLSTVPSVPSLYFKIVAALEKPDVPLSEVGGVIGQDPGMSAKVLQLVNSAFFGLARRISDPTEAVQYVGIGAVRSLVLSLSTFSVFDQSHVQRFSIERVWRHSMSTGQLAAKIARKERCDQTTIEEASVAGMLHDIGKLTLAASLPDSYQQVLSLAQKKQIALTEAEQEIFGVTHAEVGAYLLGLWGLPVSIVEAVALHHAPLRSSIKTMSPLTIVHAASVIENELSASASKIPNAQMDMDYLEELGLTNRLDSWRELASEVLAPA